jgi:hypothetical protein
MGQTQAAPNAPREMTALSSTDECIRRLGVLIEHKDKRKLDEIVALIARLTAPIQFQSN